VSELTPRQVCTCLRQLPVLCRTVLCAPPQGCRSLRVGNACCEWVCDRWDEEGQDGQASDLGLRLVASAVTAILSLSLLFFLIYRLRQRRLRGRQNHLAAEGSDAASPGGEELRPLPPHLGLKPELHHRPFPPSYDEAMLGVEGPLDGQEPEELEAPPYSAVQSDPAITSTPAPSSYPVATLGRLVLPPVEEHRAARPGGGAPGLAHASHGLYQ
jgi:hypothetical protein